MTIHVPFGSETQNLDLPQGITADLIDPADVPACTDPFAEVKRAIDQPLGLSQMEAWDGKRIVGIAINDKTRPVPHEHLLLPLLEYLSAFGYLPSAIRFYIATGTHAPMPPDEFGLILPDVILGKFQVQSHDCDDRNGLVDLGTTSRGTPVLVSRAFYEADVKIMVGNIEPHHFAGFSGGVKTAAIGLAGRETINANHAMLLNPKAAIGEFADNPLRQDIEEIGQKIHIQFALNAVLNGQKQIVQAFFGAPEAVMSAGIPVSQQVAQTSVSAKYDLVITSPGGHPKDINFYQAQKALTYASQITKDGGTIILVAACPEGSGSESYVEFMEGLDSYEAVFQKFHQEGFRVGPHKAIQVALIGSRVRVIVVSNMPAEWVHRWLMIPAPDLQSAYQLAKVYQPGDIRIAVMPHAINTIPVISNEKEARCQ
jgi:lactate racemase